MSAFKAAEKACRTKVRYPTRKRAREGRRRTPSSGHLNIYSCPWCGWYHIGHLPRDISRGTTEKDVWLYRTGAR